MKELSVREIITFSERIEKESYAFYEKAKTIVSDSKTQELADTLAKQEVAHYNKLHIFLEEGKVSREELDKMVKLDGDLMDAIVKTIDINESTSEKELLEIALVREEKTRDLYNAMFAITNLLPDIVAAFEDLSAQEQGHVDMIEKRLKSL